MSRNISKCQFNIYRTSKIRNYAKKFEQKYQIYEFIRHYLKYLLRTLRKILRLTSKKKIQRLLQNLHFLIRDS